MRSGLGFGVHCLNLCNILAILDAGSRLINFSPSIGICSAMFMKNGIKYEECPLGSSRVLWAPVPLPGDQATYRPSTIYPRPTSSVIESRRPLPNDAVDPNFRKSTVYTPTIPSNPESLPPLPEVDVFYSYPEDFKEASTSALTGGTGQEVTSIKAKKAYPFIETDHLSNVGLPGKAEEPKRGEEIYASIFGPAGDTGKEDPYEHRPETTSMANIGESEETINPRCASNSQIMPTDLAGLLRELKKLKSLTKAANPNTNPHLYEVQSKLTLVLNEIQRSEPLPLHILTNTKPLEENGDKKAKNVAVSMMELSRGTMNKSFVLGTLKNCLSLLGNPNPRTGTWAWQKNHEKMVFNVLTYLFKRNDIEHENVIDLLRDDEMMHHLTIHIRFSILPLSFKDGYELQQSWKSTFMDHPKLKHIHSLLEGFNTDDWRRVLCTFLIEHYNESLTQRGKLGNPLKDTLKRFSIIKARLSRGENPNLVISQSILDHVTKLFISPSIKGSGDWTIETYVAAYHLLDYVMQYASLELLQSMKTRVYILAKINYENMKQIMDLAEQVRSQFYNIRTMKHIQRLLKKKQRTLLQMESSLEMRKKGVDFQAQDFVGEIVKQKQELENRYSTYDKEGVALENKLANKFKRYSNRPLEATENIEMKILEYLGQKFDGPAITHNQKF